jgi:hypothetical protein
MPRAKSKETPWKGPTEEERAQFRKMMTEMFGARIETFAKNSARYAEVLGGFRASLIQSGFSAEESMQIVLRVAEQQGGRVFGRGPGGEWHKR